MLIADKKKGKTTAVKNTELIDFDVHVRSLN